MKRLYKKCKEKKKVRDRLTENPEDNSYINTMSLPDTRIWIRYRGRAITGVKGNFKNSHTNDMSCRFCPRVPNETIEVPEETQEHIEICEGTQNERRGLDKSAGNPKILETHINKTYQYVN